MEATSDDKQILSIKILRIFIRRGWGMYLLIRRYDRKEKSQSVLDSRNPVGHCTLPGNLSPLVRVNLQFNAAW
jgi:hypothetical protein